MQLKDILKEKRRGKVTKGVLFLHDNAPAHRALVTKKKLAYLGFQCLDHPPYSQDLAPSDYHLFPGLKEKQLKGRHFSSDVEAIAAAETWLDGQLSEFFFLSGLQKLEQGAKKCIELHGEYVEQIPSVVAVACFLPRRAKELSVPPRTFCICQIIQKKWEHNEAMHQLFTDFKKPYDSVRREVLYNILIEFRIPMKM